jgi:flagella basal body P-ring formation protein FlgA
MTPVASNQPGTHAHARKLALIALLASLVVALLVLLGATQRVALGQDEARGTVLLRDAVTLSPGTIKLSDVAELNGPAALALSELSIMELPAGRTPAQVTLEQICAAIDAAGVNRARVEIRGYARCVVSVPAPVAPPAAQPAKTDATPRSQAAAAVQSVAASPTSLRAQVTLLLEQNAGGDPQDLRITFTDADARALDQDVSNLRLEFEPIASSSLGRVPVVMRAYQGDKPVQTIRLIADVARRTNVLTLTRPISRGQSIQSDDLKQQKLFVTDARNAPIADPALVVGQLSVGSLRPGTVLTSEHVRSPILVKKGDTVIVRCIAGGLVVTTAARAVEDGFADKRITLINERSRETFTARVTGPREAVVVVTDAVIEASAPAPAKPTLNTPIFTTPAQSIVRPANRGGA